MTSDNATLPLAGLRVLDLSYVFAVPYMAGLLSDLGAEVIKIEAPHRLDQTRRTFGPYIDNDPGEKGWNRSGSFQILNRGKQSLVLDMGQEEGRAIFRDLARKSDIVLENFTPRVMRKWNCQYEELCKLHPALIMLSNTGYGASGPWSTFPSQGTTLEATMGITRYTGYRGDKPWKVGQSYPDFLACWTGLSALFAALAERRKSGRGQHIDLGMYQVGVAMIPEPILQHQLGRPEPERIGNEHPEHVPDNLYRASGSDSWVALSVSNDAQWAQLARLMGRPQLADDPRFARESSRRLQRDTVNAMVADWVRDQDAHALSACLQSHGIAAGPVLNNRDLLLDAHLRHRGFFELVAHREPIGTRPLIGRPYRLRNRAARITKAAPMFGEDNRSILGELLGYGPEEIQALVARQVICDEPVNPIPYGPIDVEAAMKRGTIMAVDADYQDRLGLKGKEDAPDA